MFLSMSKNAIPRVLRTPIWHRETGTKDKNGLFLRKPPGVFAHAAVDLLAAIRAAESFVQTSAEPLRSLKLGFGVVVTGGPDLRLTSVTASLTQILFIPRC